MMEELDQKDLELIDRYLLDALSQEDRLRLEKLTEDLAFQKELKHREDIMRASQSVGRDQLKGFLQTVEQTHPLAPIGQIRKPFFRRPIFQMAIAAVFALLIASWLFLRNGQIDQSELFAEHFTPYPNHVVVLARDTGSITSPLKQAFYLYEQGDFQTAFDMLAVIPINDSSGITIEQQHLYMGISLLALGKGGEAEKVLTELSDRKNSPLSQPADWYLALAYLSTNQIDKTKSQLDQVLKQEDHAFYEDAQLLHTQL